jgi:hypothetical protein
MSIDTGQPDPSEAYRKVGGGKGSQATLMSLLLWEEPSISCIFFPQQRGRTMAVPILQREIKQFGGFDCFSMCPLLPLV